MLNNDRLEVYHLAREFNREVQALCVELPRGHSDSRDNLRRAAMSITRNIAEGSGKWMIRDKVNFYLIARGSAMECAASLDELVDFGVVASDRVVALRRLLVRVAAMLTAMIRSVEARDSRAAADK